MSSLKHFQNMPRLLYRMAYSYFMFFGEKFRFFELQSKVLKVYSKWLFCCYFGIYSSVPCFCCFRSFRWNRIEFAIFLLIIRILSLLCSSSKFQNFLHSTVRLSVIIKYARLVNMFVSIFSFSSTVWCLFC